MNILFIIYSARSQNIIEYFVGSLILKCILLNNNGLKVIISLSIIEKESKIEHL
jgi:hypothetical protein